MADETHSTTKGKVPRHEVERRLAWVEHHLARLLPLPELYRRFRRKFGAGERTAKRYVRRVHERWDAEAPAQRDAKRAELERAADAVFRVALQRKDARAATGALDLKAKLHGLYRAGDEDAGGGVLQVVFECEPEPDGAADSVPPAPDVAPGTDPPSG